MSILLRLNSQHRRHVKITAWFISPFLPHFITFSCIPIEFFTFLQTEAKSVTFRNYLVFISFSSRVYPFSSIFKTVFLIFYFILLSSSNYLHYQRDGVENGGRLQIKYRFDWWRGNISVVSLICFRSSRVDSG